MDFKGKFIKRNLIKLNKYLQRHLLYTYHLRPMILHIKNQKLKNLVGVEIGTLHGLNALSMLNNLDIKHLYLIDPYVLYDDGINTHDNRAKDLEIAKRNLKPFEDKVTFVIKTSIDAINDIPNAVDFVYIDGNHSYRYVKHDVEEYYKKVKQGGIIGGHDFRADCAGLCRAVMQFGNKEKLELNGFPTDWWYIKK